MRMSYVKGIAGYILAGYIFTHIHLQAGWYMTYIHLGFVQYIRLFTSSIVIEEYNFLSINYEFNISLLCEGWNLNL